ncbi:putative elongator complex protein 1 [Drosophila innubila]|uniref:putative elongator complex protein 1 n=1 Tax=Drosophila innubila TaxID=198719 RepID=UPI00148B7D69|nr:putative elongator complex protein 1 [Drosophila innubila]
MRNLKLQYCKEDTTGIRNAKQLLLQPDFEHKDKELTFVVTEDKIYAVGEAGDGVEEPKIIAEVPNIVGAEYLPLNDEICVATGDGEVLLINAISLEINDGTYCDVGIECMAWSPNQEVVVFITKAKNVVVMTCNYEVLLEQPLDAELATDQQFVNVGWGKKETQFHGTAGKQAAKQSPEFQPPQDVHTLPQDVCIAWRGDGAFFAVSYVASNVGRTFNVYDNEGKLQHMAEKWNGMQSALTWRPSGNWIAVPQIFSNKSTVSLFEKNGLRHREFELPFDLQTESIVKLQWSSDSDILALQTATADEQRIYLYTIGNYHWYLKQVLVYKQNDPLVIFNWSSGREHTLHVLLESGKRYIYRWNLAVDRFRNMVCVIDGKRVLLTDLLKAVVPPPMCQYTLELDSYINVITSNFNQLCLYDSEGLIHFYGTSELPSPPVIKKFVSTPNENIAQIGQLANLTQLNEKHELLATHSVGNKTHILLLRSANRSYCVESTLIIDGTVNAIAEGNNNNFYIHIINNAQIYEILFKNFKLEAGRLIYQLTQAADYIDFGYYNHWKTGGQSASGVITLRSQQLLHIDGQRIDEDVTSFIVAEDYVIYTQLNALHFVSLWDRRKVSTRNIERGAKLVMHGHDARLVLQLPRGNLEVIYPRVLLLRLIGSLLDDGWFTDAMLMVRKHRINLNIICDHNVKMFCSQLNRFLAQMHDSQWLCLFLSELQNEDYALNMYASNYNASEQQYPADYHVDRKVDYICGLLCGLMEQTTSPKDVARFRLPIITSYVKLGKLEQALLLIWKHKQTDAQLADQLLKYLLYLVDVNELYNVALGTYDFGLVLFVAQKSQKDPKEFLPYLNELKSLPLDYRKFKIDEHLKRYDLALTHLAACGAEHYDLALDVIKQHNLYKKALVIYQAKTDIHQRICVAYADHLRANAQLETASIMYERGGQLQQALLSAKHTLDWQRVLNLAKRAGESLEQVASSLVTPLQQQDRHLEAYELLKQFTKWTGVPPLQVLIDGHLYGRAIYEARLLDEDLAVDLLANRIRPALIAFVDQLKKSLSADRELFLEYKQRLLDIRQRQATANDADGAGEHDVDIDEVDLLSDTSSMHSSRHSSSSRGTGKTFRSSKNRRKHERKLLSLKPGNPFEDIALIDALHNQVTKIAHQQQQQLVRDTCKALLQLHMEDERAAGLQQLYESVLSVVQASLDAIWIPELMGGTAQHLTGPNIDYLALQKEQRYALISPLKRFKPQLNIIDWQHSVLQ